MDVQKQPDKSFASLLSKVREGSEAAVELIMRFGGSIEFAVEGEISSKVRTTEGTSGIVQKVKTRAWRAITSFRGTTEPEFVKWLRKTATNLARNANRPQGMQSGKERFIDDDQGQPCVAAVDAQLTPRSGAIEREQAQIVLLDALPAMTEQERLCWLLDAGTPLTEQQTAALLRTSVQTVRVALSKARRKVLDARTARGQLSG